MRGGISEARSQSLCCSCLGPQRRSWGARRSTRELSPSTGRTRFIRYRRRWRMSSIKAILASSSTFSSLARAADSLNSALDASTYKGRRAPSTSLKGLSARQTTSNTSSCRLRSIAYRFRRQAKEYLHRLPHRSGTKNHLGTRGRRQDQQLATGPCKFPRKTPGAVRHFFLQYEQRRPAS